MTAAAERPVRLLLVDDHPVFLDGLRMLFETESWAEVAGTARSGMDALRAAASCRPDVAVLDLRLPDLDGVELTRRLLAQLPKLRVLLLTMHGGQETVLRALASGAAGYVLKDGEPEDLIAAVRQVARGGLVVGAGASVPVQQSLGEPDIALPALSPREAELLRLLVRGMTTAAMAAHLGVAPKTVRNRVSDLFRQLGVSTRAEAMALATAAGLRPDS